MAHGERILYPCYFNAAYTRAEGRRVPRRLSAKAPVLAEIERALDKLGLKYRADEHHHPGHWIRREGRVVVEWTESKEVLMKRVAQKISGKAGGIR
ncbi:MAG: signal recognition particle subunit SRP19/SEC65 family protein [Methanoregula sp.]|jgi:signal recognition particle subunit SRP19|nr:signal recognition particle subunit SRP19/SEC65 family protein [Methanoregula sp.]